MRAGLIAITHSPYLQTLHEAFHFSSLLYHHGYLDGSLLLQKYWPTVFSRLDLRPRSLQSKTRLPLLTTELARYCLNETNNDETELHMPILPHHRGGTPGIHIQWENLEAKNGAIFCVVVRSYLRYLRYPPLPPLPSAVFFQFFSLIFCTFIEN